MTAQVQTLIVLRCDDPQGCDEVWVGGAGATVAQARADAVTAGWLWADDPFTAGELHWCPGPHPVSSATGEGA